jgi:hypothetical protein
LSFDNTTATKTSAVDEAGYSGAFTLSASTQPCGGIATFSITGKTITVTPVAAGICAENVTDTNFQTEQLTVTVTTTSISGQSVRRSSTGGH